MAPAANIPLSSTKKDPDELLPVKIIKIENKESRKIGKKTRTRSVVSELNTLKDVPQSMPIIDVQHDKTRNDKSYASAELL